MKDRERILMKKIVKIDTPPDELGIVGISENILYIRKLIKRLAPTLLGVLITGESGTGKELVAKALHDNSGRKGEFVPFNCSLFPETMIDGELFGYEKGAYSGAIERHIGVFEQANEGTLFLDEIGDMPLYTQTKILRTLEKKVIRRMGGKEDIHVDVRLICATNKDLGQLLEDKKFRNDLYYRINVYEIGILPLRERKEDIRPLITHFMNKYIKGEKEFLITDVLLDCLLAYRWSGNVRELENYIKSEIEIRNIAKDLLKGGDGIDKEDAEILSVSMSESLPRGILAEILGKIVPLPVKDGAYSEKVLKINEIDNYSSKYDKIQYLTIPAEDFLSLPYNEITKRYLENMIVRCGYNKKKAAEKADIKYSTFLDMLKKNNIK